LDEQAVVLHQAEAARARVGLVYDIGGANIDVTDPSELLERGAKYSVQPVETRPPRRRKTRRLAAGAARLLAVGVGAAVFSRARACASRFRRAYCSLNITALVCDISPAAASSGTAPEGTPLRRHAKALRQILICVPARITRTARRTIVHLPDGFRHLHVFQATYQAAYALGAP
jgi:hypothetical protein